MSSPFVGLDFRVVGSGEEVSERFVARVHEMLGFDFRESAGKGVAKFTSFEPEIDRPTVLKSNGAIIDPIHVTDFEADGVILFDYEGKDSVHQKTFVPY
ncbi:MAG: hypothetical protein ACO3QV_07140 [Candidatus Nanopelagicaceae bacterium]